MMATINVSRNYPRYQSRTSTGGILPKVAVSLLLWSPSQTIFVHSRSHWNTGPVPLDYELFSTQEITHAEHVAPYTMVQNDISQY